jgi:hypothetical protein
MPLSKGDSLKRYYRSSGCSSLSFAPNSSSGIGITTFRVKAGAGCLTRSDKELSKIKQYPRWPRSEVAQARSRRPRPAPHPELIA